MASPAAVRGREVPVVVIQLIPAIHDHQPFLKALQAYT